MPAPFDLPFVQRAVVEVALLAVGSGILGTWIVLRGLSFYAHAVGTAAFPGLVLADGLGFSPLLGALATAGIVAVGVAALANRGRAEYDSATALVLVGALAAGVILASDVFHSQGSVERLLFGSLLIIDSTDQLVAGAVGVAVLLAGALLGRRWLASGFDRDSARALGARSPLPDLLLLALVAASAVAALDAIGALLSTALLVVPAATTRLFVDRLRTWQLTTVALVVAEGITGLWLSVETNAPPGATIAVVGGGVFALAAAARAARTMRHGRQAALAAAALAALALLAGGCGGSATQATDGRIAVVATTTQLGDVVRSVGGPAVSVTQILQPNSDPHDYEPRPKDIQNTAGAQLVVRSGDGLDRWMDEVVRDAGGDPAVLDAGAGRPVALPGETDGPEASRLDPHWWHDPRNVEYAVHRIHDALVRIEPAQRAHIDRSTAAYLARLRATDRAITRCLDRVPVAQRKLVTDHDAFAYFAHRYGITVVGAVIPSQTTQAQPSAGDLADLSRVIRREHVTAVFPESSASPKLAEAIARQTGATAESDLYGDTLGPAGSRGATYLGMERANADAMARGFSGGRVRCAGSGT
ncbi:MAG TPA: zinc ABC transporter substrate-binding protein [Baekduia sp.]|nr:zinc ABC transporter substrate-binding protein [Baekduia sp.]